MRTSDFDDPEDEDDRPSRRRRDDEDDFRWRRRYHDERDDFDDFPRRRRGQAGDGLAIAAMVVGIVGAAVALVGWCCCGYFGTGLSIVIGVVAVILGFVARSQGSRSGMALAGLILGAAAILIGVLLTVLIIIGMAWLQANPGALGPGGPGGPPPGGQQKNF